MKLRIRGNSLRLRLTRGEVDLLARSGRVEDAISFGGGGALGYAIVAEPDAPSLHARFDGRAIVVTAPRELVRIWAEGEEVGIEAEEALGGASGGALRVLVEKDFACLKPRDGEGDEDAFPHPKAGTGESC